MQKTITFQNQAQLILFKCELLGQISDGFWENSGPRDHYRSFSGIEIKVDPLNVGKNFFTNRKYNFANKELVDIVGERMIASVRLLQAFPNISLDEHWDYPSSLELHAVNTWSNKIFNLHVDYYVERSNRVLANFPNVTTHQELSTAIMQGVSTFQYEKKNLRKDLLAISKIVNA